MSAIRPRWPLAAVIVAASLTVLLDPKPSPANVESERDTSPSDPAECRDPIAGVWLAETVYRGDSYRLTMQIARPDADKPDLTGTITSHYWRPGGPKPPKCAAGGFEAIIDMESTGTFDRGKLLFTGNQWSQRQQICGSSNSYIPDGFWGTLAKVDEEGQIDAGWYAVYDPVKTSAELLESEKNVHVGDVQFRRVRCADSASDVQVPTLPEPAPPAPKGSWCGCL